jgi:four helix bundle protein
VPIRTYRDLEVFKAAYRAALDTSQVTKAFPRIEQLELARQLRRSARSVPANIVEGWAKRSSALEFKRYLQTAIGSCLETRMWLEMSRDEGFLSPVSYDELNGKYERIGAMLSGLWRNWRTFTK